MTSVLAITNSDEKSPGAVMTGEVSLRAAAGRVRFELDRADEGNDLTAWYFYVPRVCIEVLLAAAEERISAEQPWVSHH